MTTTSSAVSRTLAVLTAFAVFATLLVTDPTAAAHAAEPRSVKVELGMSVQPSYGGQDATDEGTAIAALGTAARDGRTTSPAAPVAFTVTGGSGLDTVAWNFGDGTRITDGTGTSHVYTRPGVYTVTATATATGDGPDWGRATRTVHVTATTDDFTGVSITDVGMPGVAAVEQQALQTVAAFRILEPCRPSSYATVHFDANERSGRSLLCAKPAAGYFPEATERAHVTAPAAADGRLFNGLLPADDPDNDCTDAWWNCGLPRDLAFEGGGDGISCDHDGCQADARSYVHGGELVVHHQTRTPSCTDGWKLTATFEVESGTEDGCLTRAQLYRALTVAAGVEDPEQVPRTSITCPDSDVGHFDDDDLAWVERANTLGMYLPRTLGLDGDVEYCAPQLGATKDELYYGVAQIVYPTLSPVGVQPDLHDLSEGRASSPVEHPHKVALTAVARATASEVLPDGIVGDRSCATTDGVCFNPKDGISRADAALVLARLRLDPTEMPTLPIPTPPAGVSVTPGDEQLEVSWTPNPAGEQAAYAVTIAPDEGLVGEATCTGGSCQATVTGLTNLQTYAVTVVATNETASSSSEPVEGTPAAPLAATPTGLDADPGDRQVTLSWDASEHAAGYDIFVGGQQITSTTDTTYTVTGLTNGQSATFQVRAVNRDQIPSELTEPVTAKPSRTADEADLVAPTGFDGEPGDRQVVLSWDVHPDPEVETYRVWVDGDAQTVAGRDTTTLTVDGLTNGTPVTFELAAVDTSGNVSPRVTLTATPARTAAEANLAAPTGFDGVPGDRQVALSWDEHPDDEVDRYRIRVDGTSTVTVTGRDTVARTIDGLVNGTAYEFELVAIDTSGNVSPPAAITVTPSRTADEAGLAAPAGFDGVPGDRHVALSWDEHPDDEVDRYRIRVDGTSSVTVTGRDTVARTIDQLTNGTAYEFELVAIDTSGNLSPAVTVTATPTRTAAEADLAAPTGFDGEPGDRHVALSWDEHPDPEVATYRVWVDGTAQDVPAPATSLVVDGLTNGTPVTFELAVVDTSGNVSPRVDLTATPVRTAAEADLAAPTGFTGDPGDRHVALSWDEHPDDEVDRYRIRVDGTSSVTVTGRDTVARTIDRLTNGTAYEFELVAIDTSGNISPPASITVTPARTAAEADLAAPTGFDGEPGDRHVALSWDEHPDDEVAGYLLWVDDRDSVTVDGRDTLSRTVTGLTNGLTSTFALAAIDTSGNVSPLTSITVTPVRSAAEADLDAPTGLDGDPGDRHVALSWDEHPDDEIAGYRLWVDGAAAPIVLPGRSTLEHTVDELTNGTPVTFELAAYDTSGNESPRTAITRTPARTAAEADLDAPTGLAGEPGDRQVTLTWDEHPDAEVNGYQLWVDGGAPVTLPSRATVEHTVDELTNGTPVTFELAATDTSGNVSPRATVTATPSRTANEANLAAPTGFAGEPGDRHVALSWDEHPDDEVDRYRIRVDGTSSVTVIGRDTVARTIDQLTNGTAYDFELVAIDTSGNLSPPASITVTPTRTAAEADLAAPTGFDGEPGDRHVALSWDEHPDDEVAGYRVWVQGVSSPVTVTGRASLEHTIGGLVNGTPVTFELAAYDTSGNDSPRVSITRTPVRTAAEADLDAPAWLDGTPGDRQVALDWPVHPDSEVAGYRLYVDGSSVPVVVTGRGSVAYTVEGLVNGTPATFELSAYDTSGNESPRVSITRTPVRSGAEADLAPVSGFTATADATAVDTAWDVHPDEEVVGYYVGVQGDDPVWVEGRATTSLAFTQLDPGTHTFEIVAVDSSGNVSPAATAQATTLVAPAAPRNLTVVPEGTDGIHASWNPPLDSEVDDYLVSVTPDGTTVTTSSTSRTFDGLSAGSTYTVTVTARNAAGDSPTVTATITLRPAVPSFSAQQYHNTYVLINHDMPAGADTVEIDRQVNGGSWTTIMVREVSGWPTDAVVQGSRYTYRARACNAGGCSSYTSTITVNPPLGEPQFDSLWAVSNGNVVMDVVYPTSATMVQIQRRPAGGHWQWVHTLSGDDVRFIDGGADGNVTYEYRLQACAHTCSDWSDPQQVTTYPTMPTISVYEGTAPGPEVEIRANSFSPTIEIEWNDVPTGYGWTNWSTMYNIESGWVVHRNAPVAPPPGTYYFQARACGPAGCSDWTPFVAYTQS